MMSIFNRLHKETSGHVAVIFALCIIPVVSIVGFAIDFSATTGSKNKVQHVLDSSVLAGARAMQAGQTEDEIKATMTSYLNGQNRFNSDLSALSCSKLDIQFGQGTQDITASVRCAQETSIMQIVGKKRIKFDVSSTSTWGIGKLDVAFMFDVSGSMAWDGRMTKLKDAAKQAINTLKPEDGGAATEDVRVAMVSYNSMVNAGNYFEEVTGLKEKRDYVALDRWPYYTGKVTYKKRSRKRRYWYCNRFRDGECDSGWYRKKTKQEPFYETVEKADEITYKNFESTCVWERNGDHKFSDHVPGNTNGVSQPVSSLPPAIKKVYGANAPIYNASTDQDKNPEGYLAAAYAVYDDDPNSKDNTASNRNSNLWDTDGRTECRNIKPMGLTKDRNKMINYINSLSTGGGTAGHQGVSWSWYLVAEKWDKIFKGTEAPLPYDEPDSVKAVILMTDGSFNAQEFKDDQGGSDTQARAVCDAMKQQDKIIIYTVAFQAPNDGKKVLEYCASGPEFAFSPENGDELDQAYQAIATSISDLRVKF